MQKITEEKAILEFMIKKYCKKKHHTNDLCDACNELLRYALKRLEHCQYGENKGACNKCHRHCYNQQKRQQIKMVMRFSGPRMIFYKPKSVIKHFLK
ncbi:nitrous oxide-stimulated promoter family protein [Acetobacterium woodii]|uniref:nitrous oxide-stimulated promoter family protein n=1 Tax=Acetobacterium woodii TaxID=33952 RepID=UPI00030A83EA|nr:nitrous oxide-stimulated promoter family protein [Acetobacterium woodii]